MKKIILISILILAVNLWSEFDFFASNPARLAERNFSEIRITGFNLEMNVKNSLINWNSLQIFDTSQYADGSVMSNSDKKILTAADLTIDANLQAELLGFGYKNWDFSSKLITTADLNLLDKKYSKIVFYGNEIDTEYQATAGKNSLAYGWVRSTLQYSHPQEFFLGMLHPRVEAYLEKSDWSSLLNAMPIYLGAQLNLDYSLAFAEVLQSQQNFATTSEVNYYNYLLRAKHSDAETRGKIDLSLGLGAEVAVMKNAILHFSLNDLFAKLEFEDLAGITYEGTFIDSLDYLNEDYEAFDQSTENDSLRYSSHQIDLKPSVLLGFEYYPWPQWQFQAKYDGRDYSLSQGFSLAAGYQILDYLPVKLLMGNNHGAFFTEIQTGLNFANFDFDLAFSNNSGWFNYAKGLGFRTGMKVKF
ncbi:MAG: hypothetical protein R6U84_08670 [Candidatus Cloacimonadales bacterium]